MMMIRIRNRNDGGRRRGDGSVVVASTRKPRRTTRFFMIISRGHILPTLLLVTVLIATSFSSGGELLASAQEETGDGDGNGEGISCAADVRRCTDGSFVSRDPTNGCEFEPCPLLEETPLSVVTPMSTGDSLDDLDQQDADVHIEIVPVSSLEDSEMSRASYDGNHTLLLQVYDPMTIGVDCTTIPERAPLDTVCRGDVDLDFTGEEEEEQLQGEEGDVRRRKLGFQFLASSTDEPGPRKLLEVHPHPDDGTVQIELLLKLVPDNDEDVPCSSRMQYLDGDSFDHVRVILEDGVVEEGTTGGLVNATSSFVDVGTCEVSTRIVMEPTTTFVGYDPGQPQPIRLRGVSWSVSYDASMLEHTGTARKYRYDTESYTWVRGSNPRLVDAPGAGGGGGSGGDDVHDGGDVPVVRPPPRPIGDGGGQPVSPPAPGSSSSSPLVDCYDADGGEFVPPAKEGGMVDVYLVPADRDTFGEASNFNMKDRMLFKVLHPPPPPSDEEEGGVTCGPSDPDRPDGEGEVECVGTTEFDLSSNSVFRLTFLSPCGYDLSVDATTGKAFFEFLVERRRVVEEEEDEDQDGEDDGRDDGLGGGSVGGGGIGVDYGTSNQILWGGIDFVPSVHYGSSSSGTPTTPPMDLSEVSFFEIGNDKIFTRAEFEDRTKRDDIRVKSVTWNVTYDPREVVGLNHEGMQTYEYSTSNRLWIRAHGVDLVPTVEIGATGPVTDERPGGDRDEPDSSGGPAPIVFDLVPAGSEYSTSESYRGSPDFLLFAFPSSPPTTDDDESNNGTTTSSEGDAAEDTTNTGPDATDVECVTIQPFMETVCERTLSFDLSSTDTLHFNFSRSEGYIVEMDGDPSDDSDSSEFTGGSGDGDDKNGGGTVSFEFRLYRVVDATAIENGQSLVCRDEQVIRGGSDGFVPTLMADDRSQPMTFLEEESFVRFDTCGLTAVVVYETAPKQEDPKPSKPEPPMLRNGNNTVPVDVVANATTTIIEQSDKIRFQSLTFTVRYDPTSAPGGGGMQTHRYTTDSGTGVHGSNVELVPVPCVVDCGNGTASGGGGSGEEGEDDPPPTFGFAPVEGGETSPASLVSPIPSRCGAMMAALLLLGGMLVL